MNPNLAETKLKCATDMVFEEKAETILQPTARGQKMYSVPAVTGKIMRKRLLLAIFAVFLITGFLYVEPIYQTVKAQEQSNNSFSDNFSTNSGAWQYLGSAYRATTNQDLVLTPSGHEQAGVAFFKSPIQGSFTASFSYKAGGGDWQGDGFIMFFYKQQYPSTIDYTDSFDSNGAAGGNLGFNSQSIIPGYGLNLMLGKTYLETSNK